MEDNEIINKAFNELKNWNKPYMMFEEFSFMKQLEKSGDLYQKYRFLLISAKPFEDHTDCAIRFSPEGVEIKSRHKDWYSYLKSQKIKIDYVKWVAVIIAALSLSWNIYQDVKSDKLKAENDKLRKQIDDISKRN